MTRVDEAPRIDVVPMVQALRSPAVEAYLLAYYQSEILPLVTPIFVDRGHPLPRLDAGARGVVVRFRGARSAEYAVVLTHPSLPALVEAPEAERVPLEQVIARRIPLLFDGRTVDSCWAFRLLADDGAGAQPSHEVVRFLAAAVERSRRKAREALSHAA